MATASVEPRLPSWWLEDALAREGDPPPAAPLAGNANADVAIVGGGYTGLWTALALRERAVKNLNLIHLPQKTILDCCIAACGRSIT